MAASSARQHYHRTFHTMRDDYNPVTGAYAFDNENSIARKEDERKAVVRRSQLYGVNGTSEKFLRSNPITHEGSAASSVGAATDSPPPRSERAVNLKGRRSFNIVNGEAAAFPSPEDKSSSAQRGSARSGPMRKTDYNIIAPPEQTEVVATVSTCNKRIAEKKYHSSIDIREDEGSPAPYVAPRPHMRLVGGLHESSYNFIQHTASSAAQGAESVKRPTSAAMAGHRRTGSSKPYNIINPPPAEGMERVRPASASANHRAQRSEFGELLRDSQASIQRESQQRAQLQGPGVTSGSGGSGGGSGGGGERGSDSNSQSSRAAKAVQGEPSRADVGASPGSSRRSSLASNCTSFDSVTSNRSSVSDFTRSLSSRR